METKQPVKAAKKKVKLGKPTVKVQEAPKETPKEAPKPETAPAQEAGGKAVTAPLPGTINEIKVKVGDKVNAGDTVVILEAMKMQNNIEAETAGTIASINVNKGDAVMEGDTLVTIK